MAARRPDDMPPIDDVIQTYCDVMAALKLDPDNADLQATLSDMAGRIRDTQGAYSEMEVAVDDGQFEASYTFTHCKKHPGHVGFTPLPDLTVADLPDGDQTPGFLKWVKWRAQRTVKLRVTHLSPDRPPKLKKGMGPSMVGTGSIGIITPPSHQDSPERSASDVQLHVSTAAHVVYDQAEVEHTTVELFFDDDDDRSTVVKAKGVKLVTCNKDRDTSSFTIQLDNGDVKADVIQRLSRPGGVTPPTSNVTFTVSHPHGVAKRVTFGASCNVKPVPRFTGDYVQQLRGGVTRAQGLGASERQFLTYWWFCNNFTRVNGDLIKTTGFSLSDIRVEVLTHLVRDNILDIFSTDLAIKLNTFFGPLMGISTDTIKSFLSSLDTLVKSPPTSANAPQAQSSVRSADPALLGQGFESRLERLCYESDYKVMELVMDRDAAERYMGGVTADYDVMTCPGSSGSRVYSLIMDVEKPFCHVVPHSKGRTKDSGLSGGGVTVVL